MKDITTFFISDKEVLCLGKPYVLGKLLIDFLETDLTMYEAERVRIKNVIDSNDESTMKLFTKDLTAPTIMKRGYGGLDYMLLNISEDMTLKEKYAVYAIYKALILVNHVYFRVIDYSSISKFNHIELLKAFDLLSLQNEYKEAMEKCLLKDTSDKTPIKKYLDYKPNITGRAEVLFEISEDMNLYEVFVASDISSVLYIEFMKMIQNNICVVRCENCQKLFIPETKGNYDVKYCSEKACRQSGAVNAFKKKIKNNPVYGEYEKAYKRYYAQKRKGIVTQEWFDEWVKNASKLKKEALQGNLSFDEFKEQISKK